MLWQLIEQTLSRLTPADLTRLVPPLDQAERDRRAKMVKPPLQPYAKLWLERSLAANVAWPALAIQSIIRPALEQDIHHGSEISTILAYTACPCSTWTELL